MKMASAKLGMLIRNVSTSTIAAQLVKPPIQVFGLEGRYATALFSAASKSKSLENVEKELTNFRASVKDNIQFRDFIDNPVIKRKLKVDGIKALAEKLKLTPTTSNLLQLLAENGRLKQLDGIVNSFKVIMRAYKGEIPCEVTTAKELDAAQRKQLEDVLKSFLKPKETVTVLVKVDPSIIGGMIVSIGDRYVDMSVASKIKRYTDIISASI